MTVADLYQWIGCWLYMLAFPMATGADFRNSSRAYFMEPRGGYGPSHNLEGILQQGKNGYNNLTWFELLRSCFVLPTYPTSSMPAMYFENGNAVKESNPRASTDGDRHRPTRRMWDAFRCSFHHAITCSWLMLVDESMVKWMGAGMPGLMVVLRKPTPIGLELHTLCCALCGVLCWFEVYEGKELMAAKAFCDRYPRSIALTLRMVEPYFQTGRVLVADSWFGSVACALALFEHCIFCVMNVKTASKNYPKEEMLAEIGEVKGKSAAAKAERKALRGKQMAFVRHYKVGSRQVCMAFMCIT